MGRVKRKSASFSLSELARIQLGPLNPGHALLPSCKNIGMKSLGQWNRTIYYNLDEAGLDLQEKSSLAILLIFATERDMDNDLVDNWRNLPIYSPLWEQLPLM